MKILLVDPIGTGHHLEYISMISEGLNLLGHQLYFFGATFLWNKLISMSYIQGGVPFDIEMEGENTYIKIENKRIQFCQRAMLYSQQIGADVCHFLYIDHFIISIAYNKIISNKSLSICATLHAPYFSPEYALNRVHKLKGELDLIALRFLTSKGMRILVHSKKSAASFNQRFERQQFDYVPYPVKTYNVPEAKKNVLRAKIRDRLGLVSSDILLLAFGETRYDKGADLAIKMISRLPKNYHLLFAGEDTYFSRTYLAELASENGVLDQVSFDNYFIPEAEIPTYFCSSDIILIPYRKTFGGQSGPLIIAAVFGKKVVAPDLPILAETIIENNLGYLYPGESIELMAETVQKTMNAPAPKIMGKFIQDHSSLAFANAVFASYLKLTQHDCS